MYTYRHIEPELQRLLDNNFKEVNFNFSSSNWKIGHDNGSMSIYITTKKQNLNVHPILKVIKEFCKKYNLKMFGNKNCELKKSGINYFCHIHLSTPNYFMANLDDDYKIIN